MHSCSIMVESMSARNSRLRRCRAGCTTTSIGSPASAARSAATRRPPRVVEQEVGRDLAVQAMRRVAGAESARRLAQHGIGDGGRARVCI